MPYHLVVVKSSDLASKGYVINTQTGHKFSNKPIPLEKAQAQLRFLQMIESRNK